MQNESFFSSSPNVAESANRKRPRMGRRIFMYKQLTTRKVPIWIPIEFGKTFQLASFFRLGNDVRLAKKCMLKKRETPCLRTRVSHHGFAGAPQTGWLARTQVRWAAKTNNSSLWGCRDSSRDVRSEMPLREHRSFSMERRSSSWRHLTGATVCVLTSARRYLSHRRGWVHPCEGDLRSQSLICFIYGK